MTKKRLAITIGCFDMLHEGHINLLKKMKERAELVFVFLHNNTSIFENKGRFPVQNTEDRASNLLSCGLVNQVFYINNADPGEEVKQAFTIIRRKFQVEEKDMIFMRGDDLTVFPGRLVIEEYGIPIEIIKYTDSISSSRIRDEITK